MGAHGDTSWPTRKRLNHRGPLSVDVASAWYFITVCAEGHRPWASVGRDDPIAPCNDLIAPKNASDAIMSTALHFHNIGKWRLALFMVMPDHVHFIVNVPTDDGAMGSSRPTAGGAMGSSRPTEDGAMGSSRPTGLDRVIRDFKRSVSRLFKIRFQRGFFDTRLRDDAHFAEKCAYVLGNPVRKGLCATPEEWPHVMAFNRETGEYTVGRHDPMPPFAHAGGAMGSSRPTGHGAMVGRHDPMPPFA